MHYVDVRITYSETDRMGVVYYANYLIYFEQGRTEFLRSLGIRYRDWEEQRGLFLPAMHVEVKYQSPAHYDDLIRIETRVADLGAAHITFDYVVKQAETKKRVGNGSTKHPFVNKDWKPVRIPNDIRELIAPHLKRS